MDVLDYLMVEVIRFDRTLFIVGWSRLMMILSFIFFSRLECCHLTNVLPKVNDRTWFSTLPIELLLPENNYVLLFVKFSGKDHEIRTFEH